MAHFASKTTNHITQFLQTFLADPKEVGDLADDDDFDLTLQLFKSFVMKSCPVVTSL